MSEELGRELGWDDEIEKEGSDFVLLPEGDYEFKVESFERGRHAGSEKLPPCNKAVIKLKIDSDQGTAFITHNLFLHTITEGMISSFFTCIGEKKKGEKVKMNWSAVPGATGKAKIGIHSYKNKDGEDRQSNEIKKFYPKEEKTYKAGEF
ncbi:MAG: hypothetical protein RHS_6130 [Robinsoniella sp. RHS]|uniref:hypothetical protein n=1 Tax=Robinsoniella sp. RHS TaxID=1504536 RepID=UPI00064B2E61|nr:MAG: hypothetical protein RHS_6130 [Robinsoniella sp. RHS]